MTDRKIGVLFVCLGNICRSPAAEGNFRYFLEKESISSLFNVDSAGTSAYHAGEPANSHMRSAAARNGVELNGFSRQFEREDFRRFDYILAMDHENYRDILELARSEEDRNKVFLFRRFDPQNTGERIPDVPDPYYGGMSGFEKVQEMMFRTSASFLRWLRKEHGL